MRIDLHTHSSVSDGTDDPGPLVRRAGEAGLDVVALTDHDSVGGWSAAVAAAADAGVVVVRGIEISTVLSGVGVHVLAYLPDPGYPPLSAELARIRADRVTRVAAIVERLEALGVALTADEVLAAAGPAASVGRPHVADALVAKGYVADREEAFARLLGEGGPAYVRKYAPPTVDAIGVVRDAGGVSVIAHPWGRVSRRVLDEAAIAALAAAGLIGLEVDHEDHDATARRRLRELAAELDLIVTGSSDHHGAGKNGHELGINTTSQEEYERLLERARSAAAAAGRSAPAPAGEGSR